MDVFYFSHRQTDSATGYRAFTVPTNLANWGNTPIVGNLTVVNRGAAEVSVYVTKTNPGYNGPFGNTADFQAAREALEASKIIAIPTSEALIGQTLDWIPFQDLNYVTFLVADTVTQGLDMYVQLYEQRVPQ